jgi:hypothetical protein
MIYFVHQHEVNLLMKLHIILGTAAAVLFLPPALRAEVVRVEISKQENVLNGKTFGRTGAYERLTGKVHFAVAVDNSRNRIIADLDKAPRNAQGRVEFSSDVFIIRPKDPSRGNGVAFFDVVNRGNKALLSVFDQARSSADPTTEADFGDGLLLREGFTLVFLGWQFDVPKDKSHIGFDAPVATDNGRPLKGWVNPWFIPNKTVNSFLYASGYFSPAYPPVNPNDQNYRLTEREGFASSPRLLPRGDWQFGESKNGNLSNDVNWITLKGGFQAGMTYELAYETQNPPVAGLGFAAFRDLASAVKYGDTIVHARYVYTYGGSQAGRYQRHLLYDGFTTDEQGRQAIDAMFIQTGATGLGSFNQRFAQPNELGSFTQTMFPIRYEITTDPATGKRDGLGARVPAGQDPKLFLVDTGSEYWDRGRVASLRHLSMDGREDLADPPNVRVYFLAGTQHGPGTFPPQDDGGQLKSNPNNFRPVQAGLLIALDQWVRKDVAPPPSQHPEWRDATLVDQRHIKFPEILGVRWPYHIPGGYRADVNGAMSVLPFHVPQVDADGNDIGGIRMPEQAVPLGTYTDWNFRGEKMGAPETVIAMAGGYIPFARTKAERERNKDPRLSIEERYSSRTHYLKRIEASAKKLAADRFILEDQVAPMVEEAGKHWDYFTGKGGAASGGQ